MGIWSPNCAEWTIVQFATAKIGAILVNINPSYRLHEVQYALKQSGCAYLVIAPQFKTSDYTEMVHDLAPELAACRAGYAGLGRRCRICARSCGSGEAPSAGDADVG